MRVLLLSCLCALLLTACTEPAMVSATGPAASAAPTAPRDQDLYLLAEALYGEPVFARDVTTFSTAITRHIAAPRKSYRFSSMGGALPQGKNGASAGAIKDLAARARDGQDLVVVMLTSHGGPDLLAYKEPGGPDQLIPASVLKQHLAPLTNDKHIVVLQACYSGSLIDDLAHPNRIILTAAAKDRTSFGCKPTGSNTWFIDALSKSIAQGGTWEEIAARTKGLIRAREKSIGMPAALYSNPQTYVGRNMQGVWKS